MRRLPRLLILIFPLFIIAQCGLERGLTIWDMPAFSTPPTTGMFTFLTQITHQSTVDKLFMGYLLYYKIQTPGYDWSVDINISDANSLSSFGFLPLLSASDVSGPPPLIQTPVLATDNFAVIDQYTVTLDFTDVKVNLKPSANSSIGTFTDVELRRSIANNLYDEPDGSNSYRYKKFKEFVADDADIPAGTITGSMAEGTEIDMEICVYVVAYGRSIDQGTFWQEIKSIPRCLLVSPIKIYYDDGID
jgi:hypothetical protein